MKITIYELLGMIKDGKAPKRIIYDEYVYELDKDRKNYEREIDPLTTLNWDYITMNCLNEKVEILEEEKELHANNIEFNINNDKRDCIITLDKNDLGIDKLHLDNCYFYKENDKWYIKKYDFKSGLLSSYKNINEFEKLENNMKK